MPPAILGPGRPAGLRSGRHFPATTASQATLPPAHDSSHSPNSAGRGGGPRPVDPRAEARRPRVGPGPAGRPGRCALGSVRTGDRDTPWPVVRAPRAGRARRTGPPCWVPAPKFPARGQRPGGETGGIFRARGGSRAGPVGPGTRGRVAAGPGRAAAGWRRGAGAEAARGDSAHRRPAPLLTRRVDGRRGGHVAGRRGGPARGARATQRPAAPRPRAAASPGPAFVARRRAPVRP